MRLIIRHESEREEKRGQCEGQSELILELRRFVGAMSTREGRAAKIVKPVKVPVWTEKMMLETYEKVLKVWVIRI